ncbi:HoxN/HupN/NixA family nickel/cobalt transporter [Patulibacter sp. NPDC049589]|uniref:HoxN/HupN/NixA family nickel/cobalt transporter n=1 Tax=Patulibacter sp. NPDC049589 TaxID=3154731 RepID=UPI00342066DA
MATSPSPTTTGPPGPRPSVLAPFRGMIGTIVVLHVLGLGLLLIGARGEHHLDDGQTFGLATGLLAYTLGLRHAFDADHIGAIDNVTRRLVARGQRPVSVGFWFSLGHSTVVLALALLLAVGVKSIGGAVQDDGSALHTVTGLIGPIVSTVFLLGIAAANVALLRSALRRRRAVQRGTDAAPVADDEIAVRGPLMSLLGPIVRRVDRPGRMYPLGFLFGLGFDTATEVALLVLAGGGVAAGLPFEAILALPLLFAAGMCACDTANGVFMRSTYDRAAGDAHRRAGYDVLVTGVSVVAALGVGTIQAISIAGEQLDLTGGIFAWVDGLDMTIVGYGVVGVFLAVWIAMIAAARRTRPGPTAT